MTTADKYFIAIDSNGKIIAYNNEYEEHDTESEKIKEYMHVKTSGESLQDILDKANSIVAQRVLEHGHQREALIDIYFGETAMDKRILKKFPQYRKELEDLTNEAFCNIIRDRNAYDVFSIMPGFVEADSEQELRELCREFSRKEQGLLLLPDGDIYPGRYDVLEQLGREAGCSGDLFEMPLRIVFKQFMEADIYSSFDTQNFDDLFVIINGVERISGESRKVFTKKEAAMLTGEHIIIPEGYTDIGTQVFGRVKPDFETERHADSIKSIIIPEGVKRVWDRAFSGCRKLERVVLPESLTEIYDLAFSGCSSLTDIVIPESVLKIGNEAFNGCENLVLPDTVIKQMEENAK